MTNNIQPIVNLLPAMFDQCGNGFEKNHRILIVDDNKAIHDDFRKIFRADSPDSDFDAIEAEVFGAKEEKVQRSQFEIDFAFQGQEALKLVQAAVQCGRRYAMVFMDVRMPPGWDGLETTLKLWEVDSDLQIVICTAYSDYSWEEMMKMIGTPERLLILKKPFDSIEVLQFAHALTEKWSLLQAGRRNSEILEHTVGARTQELKATNAVLEQEISEHKAAAERIREQAMLIEEARDAIIVRDFEENILFWNQGAERIYGWAAAEVLGKKILDVLYDGMEKENVQSAMKGVFDKGAWAGELPQKARDGRIIHCDCHWTLIRDDQGRPKSILTINSDITEKKKIEAQFLRTQRLESIGVLTGGIAHDLNNILAPALMACGLLAPVSEQDKDTVKLLRESIERGADIIKQILSFARGANGSRVELDARHLINEIGKIAAETFPRNIQIAVDASPDLWTLAAEPTQLQQVLMNLCVNARDAMPTGGALTIGARNMEVDAEFASRQVAASLGRHVLISVEDTGTGIASEIQDKIFDPFFTTKDFGKGTGLGLSTTFGIVKSHGGFIEFDSEQGKGTAFRIYLPVKTGVAPATETKSETSEPLPRGRNELILVVDDEELILKIAKQTLETFGYRAVTAKDGVEALVTFAQEEDEIDLVLTDIMMPAMDGLALISALKSNHPDLRIIAASGVNTESQLEKVVAAGANHFIPKPYTARALLDILDDLLHSAPHPVGGA